MRDVDSLRERYLRDTAQVRMGHLASDLLRLANWARMRRSDEAVLDLMGEIAWLMEWNEEFACEELADMQREICHWRRIWPVEAACSLLTFRAQRMSDRILELSGLLEQPTSEAAV